MLNHASLVDEKTVENIKWTIDFIENIFGVVDEELRYINKVTLPHVEEAYQLKHNSDIDQTNVYTLSDADFETHVVKILVRDILLVSDLRIKKTLEGGFELMHALDRAMRLEPPKKQQIQKLNAILEDTGVDPSRYLELKHIKTLQKNEERKIDLLMELDLATFRREDLYARLAVTESKLKLTALKMKIDPMRWDSTLNPELKEIYI